MRPNCYGVSENNRSEKKGNKEMVEIAHQVVGNTRKTTTNTSKAAKKVSVPNPSFSNPGSQPSILTN
jgi:hypothetical protein